jgi:hypothetical protein
VPVTVKALLPVTVAAEVIGAVAVSAAPGLTCLGAVVGCDWREPPLLTGAAATSAN